MSLPSKRPYERSPLEPNGRGKWQKTASFASQTVPMKMTHGGVVFRILFPVSKSGSLIGKGGSVVKKIRKESGAKIKIEETEPGCDERIVVIMGFNKGSADSNVKDKNHDEEKNNDEENNDDEDSDDSRLDGENTDDKELSAVEELQSEKETSSVQKALFMVFERIVEREPELDEGDEEKKEPSTVTVRLLVLSTQVGCVLGKGGSVIKQMAAESGAQIRILPRDKLPSCASPVDELVQITGEVEAVRKALQSVSQKLLENPPREQDSFPAGKLSGLSSRSFAPSVRPEVFPPVNHPYPAGPLDNNDYPPSLASSFPIFFESGYPGRLPISAELLTFRMLCMNDKVGGAIGKGGVIIRSLQNETGCDIKILETVPESDDRIVIISGPSLPDDRISPPQDALLRVHSRTVTAAPDGPEDHVLCRLLVSSNQIGCILGKGGAIITEMRKFTGAHIRVLGKDKNPQSASEYDEVVVITGVFEVVQEALMQISTRLRHHLFRDKLSAMGHPSHPSFDQLPPFPPYMGRLREQSPPGLYSKLRPFHKFDSVGGFRPHDDRVVFHQSGAPAHSSERMPWISQGIGEVGGRIPMPDYVGGGPQRRYAEFGGGNQPAVITSTTVEVVVPQAVVPDIRGVDGGSLKQIRQISGAKITITDPKPGASETAIIISGTPEQTHAAQSLLQAFVMSGTSSP
ncbi:KH domain-containing protein [Acorus calamus]|uniref:KH domain-containing protein n=1 Tax=Acorus calamus TaxID=4465 RepID=A0AAV9DJ10_ACOCL|nr:KH domain-containing protein [Acorus calamus]